MGSGRITLTASQRRFIGSSLQVVEEQIAACRHLLSESDADPTTFHYGDLLTAEEVNSIESQLDELHACIASIAAEAGTRRQERSARRTLAGTASSMWETLEDLRPKRLKAYGPLEAESVDRLAELVDRAAAAATGILDSMRGR